MAKNLIIGGCTNYNINQLKPWVLSINDVVDDNVEKVMCVGNASVETRQWLVEMGFKIVDMPQANIPVHVLRFLSIYEYLKHNYKNYKYVVTTDVKDVYFQKDPFEYLEINMMRGKKLMAASEGMYYKDEPWGNENLMQTYGPYVYEQFKSNPIYNVGVVAGYSEYVKDLVFNIFTNAVNRPIPIVDQAVYNVLINTQPYKDIIQYEEHDSGWACQAGTTVDPYKIQQFRPKLICGEPIYKDGYVLNSEDNFGFAIVHQYDRVPEWKEFVRKKYNQYDESEYITITT